MAPFYMAPKQSSTRMFHYTCNCTTLIWKCDYKCTKQYRM